MAKLSVNVNKIATLRNSRGGPIPSVVDAARVCVEAGAPGITVHPRADARHITFDDVQALKHLLEPWKAVEFNIEGDPRPDLLNLVERVRPHQCTLVPVRPGEITSEAGWPPDTDEKDLRDVIARLRGHRHPRVAVRRCRREGGATRAPGRRRPRRAVHGAVCACVLRHRPHR